MTSLILNIPGSSWVHMEIEPATVTLYIDADTPLGFEVNQIYFEVDEFNGEQNITVNLQVNPTPEAARDILHIMARTVKESDADEVSYL